MRTARITDTSQFSGNARLASDAIAFLIGASDPVRERLRERLVARDRCPIECPIRCAATSRSGLSQALVGENVESLDTVVQSVVDLLEQVSSVEPRQPRNADTTEPNEIRLAGNGWAIRYEGRSLLLPNLKGLRYLAHLLAEPGREMHVLDLVSSVEGDSTQGGRVPDGDTGEILDERARSEYRSHLRDLREELEEATANADTGRAERLRNEIEFVAATLSAAYGLGGRVRRDGDVAERARKAVTNRIRVAIERVARYDSNLSRHLTATVRTGRFCVYEPQEAVHWTS